MCECLLLLDDRSVSFFSLMIVRQSLQYKSTITHNNLQITQHKARRKRYDCDDNTGKKGQGKDAVCALKIVSKAAFWTRVVEGAKKKGLLGLLVWAVCPD